MQKMNKLGALRRVEFIWINRDTGAFEWFQALLKQLEDVTSLSAPLSVVQRNKFDEMNDRRKPIPTSFASILI